MKCVVVGGGLAGTFLSARLIERGAEVTLFDPELAQTASSVAAGVFHVISGQRAVKMWLANELTAALFAFFEQPEYRSLAKHLHPLPVFRPLLNAYQYNDWSAKVADDGFRQFVRIQDVPFLPNVLHNPLGGLLISQCGQLAVPQLLPELKRVLIETGRFRQIKMALQYEAINVAEKRIEQNGLSIQYDALAFCEGVAANDNPFWRSRPIIGLKGQLLHLQIPDFEIDRLLVGNHYLIPPTTSCENFIFGATYEREYDSPDATPEGRQELIEEFKRFLPKLQPRILAQQSAVRPTTSDRRPVVCAHPEIPSLYFFNGLGTKGVLLSPYFSALLAEEMVTGQAVVPKELKMTRFKELR